MSYIVYNYTKMFNAALLLSGNHIYREMPLTPRRTSLTLSFDQP